MNVQKRKSLMFDVYGTLATWHPDRSVIQSRAAAQFGINLTKEGIDNGYSCADAHMTHQNIVKPIRNMNAQEREAFFARYEQLVLDAAGVQADTELATRIWRTVSKQDYKLALFDDVIDNLDALRNRGYAVGIVSNMNISGAQLASDLGLDGHIDFAVTSFETNCEKPDERIFQEAMRRAGNRNPTDSTMIGDQPESDMFGAEQAGMNAILLDRYDLHPQYREHPRATSMQHLQSLLTVL